MVSTTRATGLAAMASPFATALPTGTMPWQAELALALSGPFVCGLHHFWSYRLSSRALEYAARNDVVHVLAYGTGQPPGQSGLRMRRERLPVRTGLTRPEPRGGRNG